jgi:hypothetical protein
MVKSSWTFRFTLGPAGGVLAQSGRESVCRHSPAAQPEPDAQISMFRTAIGDRIDQGDDKSVRESMCKRGILGSRLVSNPAISDFFPSACSVMTKCQLGSSTCNLTWTSGVNCRIQTPEFYTQPCSLLNQSAAIAKFVYGDPQITEPTLTNQ